MSPANGSVGEPGPGNVVVGGAETVDYILARAAETGEVYLPEQVHAVIAIQLAYLRASARSVRSPTATICRTESCWTPGLDRIWYKSRYQGKEVVQTCTIKSGTLEVRGR